jgi:hypothetical protein
MQKEPSLLTVALLICFAVVIIVIRHCLGLWFKSKKVKTIVLQMLGVSWLSYEIFNFRGGENNAKYCHWNIGRDRSFRAPFRGLQTCFKDQPALLANSRM